MGTSHLVMGELTDYLTGQTLPDTHDERLIQQISRFLVEDKGFSREDILSRKKMSLTVDGKTGTVVVHFIILINHVAFAVGMYGPGSIVTRQRPAIAVARLVEDHVVPYAFITNGRDANLLDSNSGKVIGKDLNSIYSKTEALQLFRKIHLQKLSEDRREKEQRILYTMDILTHAECDEFVCGLP